MKACSLSRTNVPSSLASMPASSERRNSSCSWLAWALSCMCSSSTRLIARLRMPLKPTSATARDTVPMLPPAPLKRTVFTRRSSLLVSATSLRISPDRLSRLPFFAAGDALDARHRIRQRGEVAVVAHAAQQEVEHAAGRLAVRPPAARVGPLLAGRQPGGQRVAELGGTGPALLRHVAAARGAASNAARRRPRRPGLRAAAGRAAPPAASPAAGRAAAPACGRTSASTSITPTENRSIAAVGAAPCVASGDM